MHTLCERKHYQTLITGLTWHNISSLFTHSHTAKLLRESWQIVRGPLFLSSSDGRLWISDWKLHTDSDEAYAPSVRINRKSSLLSVWLIGILVSVSLRVQMNPDELFLVDKRSNIRVSPSVAARCFLLSWTDLSHGLSRKLSRRVLYELSSPNPEKKKMTLLLACLACLSPVTILQKRLGLTIQQCLILKDRWKGTSFRSVFSSIESKEQIRYLQNFSFSR